MKIKVALFAACLIFLVNIADGQMRDDDSDANLCEIEVNPEGFLDKPFDVKAVYYAGFETGWLDDSCHPRQRNRIAYRFDENFESNTRPKVLKRWNKLLQRKIKIPGDVRKISGIFTIQIKKHIKRTENGNPFDYDVIVLKIISVTQEKK